MISDPAKFSKKSADLNHAEQSQYLDEETYKIMKIIETVYDENIQLKETNHSLYA